MDRDAEQKRRAESKDEEKDISVQIAITMAARPNHRASALLETALEEVKKALQANEVPDIRITQSNEQQGMQDRLAARVSVEVAQRLSRLKWKIEYVFQ